MTSPVLDFWVLHPHRPTALTKSLDGKIRNLDGSVPDVDQSGLFAQGCFGGFQC